MLRSCNFYSVLLEYFQLEVTPINSVQSFWDGFDFTYILSILLGVIPSLLCITLHELSHGLVAYKLGDDTAKSRGRLSLNPLKHLDPVGLLMMLVFHVGWAKPVPVNMYKFKNPKRGMAVTALAGPLSNLIIAVVFMLIYGAAFIPLNRSSVGQYFLQMIQLTAVLSIGLGIFNILPIPPLDGSKVIFSLLRDEDYYKLMRYERYGGIIMIILVATGVLGRPLNYLIDLVYLWLVPLAQLACDGVMYLFYM